MNNKTKSEELFETYCRSAGLAFERIITSDTKSPDYYICPSNTRVIVEVKQINMNKDERSALENSKKGIPLSTALSSTPGDRIRIKIKNASPQIKSLTNGVHPSILVVFDNTWCGHTDRYFVKAGMYGLEQHVLRKAGHPDFIISLERKKLGPKKKMSRSCNTSISAVGIIKINDYSISMDIYHNIYASNPLNPDLLRFVNTKHFTLQQINPNELPEWIEF